MTVIDVARDRASRAARRSLWSDALEAAMWLAAVAGIAFMIASGGFSTATAANWWNTLGRSIGIVAAVMMMTQVLLASRAPWIEKVIGHDRAIAKHTRLGKVAILLMFVHLILMTATTAAFDGRSFVEQTIQWQNYGWFMLFAQIAAVSFLVVLATSLAAVRLRWRYERWHAVHLLVYVGVASAVPHQFLEGSTFVGGGVAWWFWAALWTVSIGSFIVFRLVRPAVLAGRHRLVVESVDTRGDGSTTLTIAGRDVDRLRAQAGQFFLWRFLSPGMRWQSHPYSLSAAPGNRLRITVKDSGDGSGRVAHVPVGTRVMTEGPLGIFTHSRRAKSALLLVSAGIGITPVRSMLEAVEPGDDCTVVVRVRSRANAPLLDEVEALAETKGATLHVLEGRRGETWGTEHAPVTIGQFVADAASTDVYVCGPPGWATAVAADAAAAGIPAEAIHREEFGW
ncbi:ferredoxin reductase family protein [Demequina oxidasica]|uniref:ferredoxin reductase family protein n=1 Tax=Demequina oxidasica TaxID=676199 RepID=UPI0007825A50|nr:ferredoxin reductase family protein [Demequina oxidasica]